MYSRNAVIIAMLAAAAAAPAFATPGPEAPFELFAREDSSLTNVGTQDSGALNIGGSILKGIGGFFGFKREEIDMLVARAEQEQDQSEAFNFGNILKDCSKLIITITQPSAVTTVATQHGIHLLVTKATIATMYPSDIIQLSGTMVVVASVTVHHENNPAHTTTSQQTFPLVKIIIPMTILPS